MKLVEKFPTEECRNCKRCILKVRDSQETVEVTCKIANKCDGGKKNV